MGRRIVYLAESSAGAVVEVLFTWNLEEDEVSRSHTLLHVSVPEHLATEHPPEHNKFPAQSLHADAETIQVIESTRAEFDFRLLKHLRG